MVGRGYLFSVSLYRSGTARGSGLYPPSEKGKGKCPVLHQPGGQLRVFCGHDLAVLPACPTAQAQGRRLDKEPQENNKAVPERGFYGRFHINHTFFCFDLYWNQNLQQPPDGSTVTFIKVDETTQDVPRQSLDHAISGFDDAVHNGRQLDRVYHIYGVSFPLVGMYVGLPGQSDRTRSQLVDGPIS